MTLPGGALQGLLPNVQAFQPYAGSVAPFAKEEAQSPAWMLFQRAQEIRDDAKQRDYVAQLQASRAQLGDMTQRALAQQLLEKQMSGATELSKVAPVTPNLHQLITGLKSTPFFDASQQQRPNNETLKALGDAGQGLGRLAEFAGQTVNPQDLGGLAQGARIQQGTPTAVTAAAAGATGRNQPTTTFLQHAVDPATGNMSDITTRGPQGIAPPSLPQGFRPNFDSSQVARPQPFREGGGNAPQDGGMNTPPPVGASLENHNGKPMLVVRDHTGRTLLQLPADQIQQR